MFAALGHPEDQERIRQTHPEQTHCFLLKLSAKSCAELPQDFGDIPAGSICPNNPYHANADKLLRRELSSRLMAITVDIHRAMRIGGVTPASPRIEVTLGYAYQRWLEERQSWLKS